MIDKVEQIIDQYKLRKTKLRLGIFSFFLKNKGPQLLKNIKSAIKNITSDRVTIYRELERLRACGAIEQVSINDEISYELTNNHHHHAVCENCKKVICLPCDKQKENIKLPGWTKTKHQVLISGVCRRCH